MKSSCLSLLVVVISMMASCRTEYIPVESIRYDSIFIAKLQKDSIFIRDSIHVKEKGDTIFIDKLKYIYRYTGKSDTVYIERRDSIQIPYPIEKKLTRWQQIKIDFGGFAIEAIFILVLYLLIRWIIKRTRKE